MKKLSLKALSDQFLAQLEDERQPPPEGAFTVKDARRKTGCTEKRTLEILMADKRLESKMWKGRRYFWPRR
jgi:hypothetical protein